MRFLKETLVIQIQNQKHSDHLLRLSDNIYVFLINFYFVLFENSANDA